MQEASEVVPSLRMAERDRNFTTAWIGVAHVLIVIITTLINMSLTYLSASSSNTVKVKHTLPQYSIFVHYKDSRIVC